MDEQIKLTQELIPEKLQKGILKVLNDLKKIPATMELANLTRERLTKHLTALGQIYGAEEKIEVSCYPEKGSKNIIISGLNLTTCALLQGFNIQKKTVLDNEVYTFWEFTSGVLRLTKATKEVVFIPPIVYDHLFKNPLPI